MEAALRVIRPFLLLAVGIFLIVHATVFTSYGTNIPELLVGCVVLGLIPVRDIFGRPGSFREPPEDDD